MPCRRLWLAAVLALPGFLVAAPDDATLSWAATTASCDGGSITPPLSYRIYYGRVGRVAAGLPASSGDPCGDQRLYPGSTFLQTAYPETPISIPGNVLSHRIVFTGKQPGRYYFAIGAVDATGGGPVSNEVSKEIVLQPPQIVLSTASCQGCEPRTGTLLVGVTGVDVTVSWPAAAAATSVEGELHLYPVRANAVPIARATLSGSATSWTFRPGRSELHYVRLRSCNASGCSAWGNSFEQGLGWLFYFRIAPATGGGLD